VLPYQVSFVSTVWKVLKSVKSFRCSYFCLRNERLKIKYSLNLRSCSVLCFEQKFLVAYDFLNITSSALYSHKHRHESTAAVDMQSAPYESNRTTLFIKLSDIRRLNSVIDNCLALYTAASGQTKACQRIKATFLLVPYIVLMSFMISFHKLCLLARLWHISYCTFAKKTVVLMGANFVPGFYQLSSQNQWLRQLSALA